MAVAETSAFGGLLRRWREARRMSQLDLGMEAEVSPRHISFIETGRSQPSREMVLLLSGVLDVPLRERNALLHAAGFAPLYRETDLGNPHMSQARQALQLILRQQEPFSAIVFDRLWNMVMVNAAMVRLHRFLFGAETAPPPLAVLPEPRPNLLRMLFDPAGWRPCINNWETVARTSLARLHRQALWDQDEMSRRLLRDLLAYPGVPARWREPDFDLPQTMLLPVEIRLGDHILRLFSTVSTLGSPQDVTLQELHIETFHPVDEETESLLRAFAEQR